MKVILDCNVLIAAGLKDGICRSVALYCTQYTEMYLSEEVLLEYLLVARRKKFIRYQQTLEKLIILFTDVATMVEADHAPSIILPDPNDLRYVHLAMHVNADYLITGNTKDFPNKIYGATKIITPREFFDLHIKN